MDAAQPQRVGVFGGTFDPVHIGHLILAAEALCQLKLERILWLLTPFPPHKTGREVSTLTHREEMLKLAIADEEHFELSPLDIQRPPPHYAADSVALLRRSRPDLRWVYLMGGDSLADLPNWMRPLEFIQACDEIGVLLRPGRPVDLEVLEQSLPGIKDKVRWIKAPLLEISSSSLRQKIAVGGAYRYYLPPDVYAYIEGHQLYQ